jgi:hypothetical protein
MTRSASSPTETPTETILVVDDDLEVLSVTDGRGDQPRTHSRG